jgi:hypothetical protein
VTLVTEKWLENSRKECEIIHREVECGREPVARCAQVEISTKCRRKCSEGREKSRKLSSGGRAEENIQGGESLRFHQNP